jgi:hypothetical protein
MHRVFSLDRIGRMPIWHGRRIDRPTVLYGRGIELLVVFFGSNSLATLCFARFGLRRGNRRAETVKPDSYDVYAPDKRGRAPSWYRIASSVGSLTQIWRTLILHRWQRTFVNIGQVRLVTSPLAFCDREAVGRVANFWGWQIGCPSCHSEKPRDKRFCLQCGLRLEGRRPQMRR